jgi:Cu(I)/Ag(I) efflux system membrane fusion protein
VRPGTKVEARSPALPGTYFSGKVSAILPEVNPRRARSRHASSWPIPARKLVPGMFATVQFGGGASSETRCWCPSEAVIQTGKRTVVMVAAGEGQVPPVDVEIGAEANGRRDHARACRRARRWWPPASS